MCEWVGMRSMEKVNKLLNKTPIYKFDKFYFFNLKEKFIERQIL